jgi:broad specificity phosphatase PhoE
MTRILLIRHGRTEWNRQEIFRGRADIPLSDQGTRQAEALAGRLSDERIAAVYSSPLIRAYATAEQVAKAHGLQPQTVDDLTDIDYEAWEGQQHEQVAEQYADLYARWRSEPHLVRPPGGETLGQVRERAYPALLEIVARHAEAAVALVSHRVVSKLILCAALDLGDEAFWRIRRDTCCLNVLEWSGQTVTVCLLNDTCHLGGLAKDAMDF